MVVKLQSTDSAEICRDVKLNRVGIKAALSNLVKGLKIWKFGNSNLLNQLV